MNIYLKDILSTEELKQREYLDKALRFEKGDLDVLVRRKIEKRSFLKSLGFAWSGLVYAFKHERNIRIHSVCAVLALVTGISLGFTGIEMAFLLLVISMVILLELVNTALELTLDHTHGSSFHPLVKIIKDVIAGGVLLAAINSVIVGTILLLRHI